MLKLPKLILVAFLFLAPSFSDAQEDNRFPPTVTVNESLAARRAAEAAERTAATADRDTFRQAVLKAARTARNRGTISRRDFLRLRVAMFSPAFRQHAQDLAVIQMAFSGDDVPETDDGQINQTAIDWEGLATFLERLLPLLLQLLDALG